MKLHECFSAVQRLQVHLPNQPTVVFSEDVDLQKVVGKSNVQKTKLTEWFTANRNYATARDTPYGKFSERSVWNKTSKKWTPCQRGTKIDRVYYAHPASEERYYLRMLLNVVCRATCFENLRTVDGRVCVTFKEACQARGLLENDQEWA
jgi:hypothetical protein